MMGLMKKHALFLILQPVLPVLCILALLSGCSGKGPVSAHVETPPMPAETASPVEILEAPEIAAEITALPIETASPDPVLDEQLMAHALNAGDVDEEHMRIVLRYLAKSDPAAYMDWLVTEERNVIFYREVPFESGHLVLAMEPYDGEIDPNLYYVLDGRVAAQSYGADCWSIDVARFLGKTVVFGPSFAEETDTTKIIASFFDGQTVTQNLTGPSQQHPVGEGYILVADGTPDLKSLTIFAGTKPVADQSAAIYHINGDTDRSKTQLSVFDAVHLCVMNDHAPDWAGGVVTLDGAPLGVYDYELTKYFKNAGGWIYTDAWRNNNAAWNTVTVPGGSVLTFKNLPGGVMASYLVTPARDDGKDAGAALARQSLELVNGSVTLPPLPTGAHVLVLIETNDAVHALSVGVK